MYMLCVLVRISACIYLACICSTCSARMQLGVCLNMSVCQGAEESDAHVLGSRNCVGWRVCPEQDSPHVSICVQIALLCASDTVAYSNMFLFTGSMLSPAGENDTLTDLVGFMCQGNALEVCANAIQSFEQDIKSLLPSWTLGFALSNCHAGYRVPTVWNLSELLEKFSPVRTSKDSGHRSSFHFFDRSWLLIIIGFLAHFVSTIQCLLRFRHVCLFKD